MRCGWTRQTPPLPRRDGAGLGAAGGEVGLALLRGGGHDGSAHADGAHLGLPPEAERGGRVGGELLRLAGGSGAGEGPAALMRV